MCLLGTSGFTCRYKFLDDKQPPGVLIKGLVHASAFTRECVRQGSEEQDKYSTPALHNPALFLQDPSSQHLCVSVTGTYRRRREMSQAQGLEVTTLERNFCFYIRKTGEQIQVPKKRVTRSSQKMSSSGQMLDQVFNAVFWCDQHRPSQLCQQQPLPTRPPRAIRIFAG